MTARPDFTPQQIADFHAYQARKPALLRGISDKIGLWAECSRRECRRGRACAGSGAPCLREVFRTIPEREKAVLQRAFAYRRNGVPGEQALELAEQSLARDEAQAPGFVPRGA